MVGTVRLTADRMPLVRDMGWNQTAAVYTHPDRVLDYDVFLFVTKGCMHVIEEGTEYRVRQGEHLFLKKGLRHWGLPESEAGTAWYWIHFDAPSEEQDGYSGRLPMPETGYYTPGHYEYRFELPKHGGLPLQPSLGDRLMAMLDEYRQPRLHGMTRASIRAYGLFLDLHEATLSDEDAQVPAGKMSALTGKVMAYLVDHASKEFQAEELARRLDLNYNYISTAFRKHTGRTVIEMHTKLRIDKAIDLMRNTSLNVSEISERLGFNSPYYFSRVFKKVTGEAPSSYWRHLYRV
ncbi:AraC family transcriptional regulator [Paenibacillus sp. PAMC21692]|uniref:helix-turn-helix domain-containing protein n=1 Tax=Paenibacillus sp. PAMC21692 TaxID=2762320 RepID=UPI00164D3874|nr:AraC family transcriptional regulator [Paenibacillus sp. PAMC21692]QNK59726.1 helix-turn-helix transcriptional regulator [Paenibacillus sp. PAMC21692]